MNLWKGVFVMKNLISAYDAWLFDMDGVVTDTARLHGESWKQMFDDYLKTRAAREGKPFVPFDIKDDYHTYVDGKPRYEGVDSFLRSRGIELPFGTPDDPADTETVCGLGNRKNILINDYIRTRGADVFESTIALIKPLRAGGKKVAIVTSSKNCDVILKAAKLADLFDAKVDGIYAAEHKIAGKPKPDTYLEAARLLGVAPERSVVIEDALSGVQAGRAGKFGKVVGVARHGNAKELLENGADIAVGDLGELLEDDGAVKVTG